MTGAGSDEGAPELLSGNSNANRLLLVEDDIDTRALVAASLRHAGCDVEEASDARDALEAIRREYPSLLVTDCNMPNMTGNELLDQLAVDARLCLLPASQAFRDGAAPGRGSRLSYENVVIRRDR